MGMGVSVVCVWICHVDFLHVGMRVRKCVVCRCMGQRERGGGRDVNSCPRDINVMRMDVCACVCVCVRVCVCVVCACVVCLSHGHVHAESVCRQGEHTNILTCITCQASVCTNLCQPMSGLPRPFLKTVHFV